MNATMTRRRVRSAAVALLLAVPVLSSCATTNFDAQTDQYYTPTDGENAREGTVDVLHALIVSEEPGQGRLIAALVNGDTENEDALAGIVGAGDDEGVQFEVVEGETAIRPGGSLQLADDGSAVVAVSGDPELVAPGKYVRLTVSFENGEDVEVNVPVLEPGTDYADVEIPEPAVGGTTEPTDAEG